MLSLMRHPNLVTLYGYCAEGNQRLLVYEYMPLGSLEDHLHGNILDAFGSDFMIQYLVSYMFKTRSFTFTP